MYTIADIDRETRELIEQRECLALYWFEEGEADRSAYLPPQYADNYWYLIGWNDREYQQEIGFNSKTQRFEHF
ncbi:MAG: hypothetical protein AAGG00_05470 [Cyanobacteria bacterium P01_H01_bin.150]